MKPLATAATVMLICFLLCSALEAQTCANSSLSGTYFYQLNGALVSSGTASDYAELGKLIADGQGNLSGQSTASIGGSLAAYTLSGNYTVQLDCTGTMALSVNSQPPNSITFDIVEGGASIVVAFSSPGGVVLGQAYRTASQFGNGSLIGGYGYFLVGLTTSNGSTVFFSDAGRAVADGGGGLTTKDSANLGAGATQGTGTGSYSINSDCSGTAQVGTANFMIALVDGGNFLFLETDGGTVVSGMAQPQLLQLVLPQFVFGSGWYTALYFTNSNNAQVSFPVSFTSDAGAPLTVPALGGSSTQVTLSPQGSAIIEAPNVGTLGEGYASFSLPAGVTGYGMFRQSVSGRADQEAVVPLASATSATSRLTWDETGGAVTGVAIVNPSALATNVTITVLDTNGNVIGTSSVALQANSKTAVTLDSLPGLSGMVGKRGSAKFTVSTGNVAVLGLRFSGVAFTSVPATQQ